MIIDEKNLSYKERIELIQYWYTWFYDRTVTWYGKTGGQVAYLLASIAANSFCVLQKKEPIVKLLLEEKIPQDDLIWTFIHIVKF